MKVLGIETATEVCAAAVVIDGQVVHEARLKEKHAHAEKLMTLTGEALRCSGLTPGQIDGIAVSIGPGSFTGLRIGLSVAKGLAYATGRPLVAVPTLRALALRAQDAGEGTGFVLAALDARRDEVYCQLFRSSGGILAEEWTAKDMTLKELLDRLGDLAVTVTGNAWGKFSAYVHTHARAGEGRFGYAGDGTADCSAGSVALLGEGMLKEGRMSDAAGLQPMYLKEFSSLVRR